MCVRLRDYLCVRIGAMLVKKILARPESVKKDMILNNFGIFSEVS